MKQGTKGLHNQETGSQWRSRRAKALRRAAKKGAKYRKPEPSIAKAPVVNFYESPAWLDVRYKALIKHKAVCQCCGATRATGVTIHVDHIIPRSKRPDLALDINNLQVLCHLCNLGKLNTDQTDWR